MHAVVRDDARKMAKAMRDNGLVSLGCMAHTLQLAEDSQRLEELTPCLLTPACCADPGDETKKAAARCSDLLV